VNGAGWRQPKDVNLRVSADSKTTAVYRPEINKNVWVTLHGFQVISTHLFEFGIQEAKPRRVMMRKTEIKGVAGQTQRDIDDNRGHSDINGENKKNGTVAHHIAPPCTATLSKKQSSVSEVIASRADTDSSGEKHRFMTDRCIREPKRQSLSALELEQTSRDWTKRSITRTKITK
jgi:hypothetical protein